MVSIVFSLRHHLDEVNSCAFSPTLLATCSGDKTIRIYNINDNFSELPFSPLSGHAYGVHCCRFTSCGAYLVTCSTDGSTIIWNTLTGELLTTLEHPDRSPVRVCALAPDSSLLLSGACNGTVALWEFHSKKLRRCDAVSEASVVACCFTPCSRIYATGCTLGHLKLWDVELGLLHAEKDAHDLGVTCACFAPQYTIDDSCVEYRLASSGQDSVLKIWVISQHDGKAYEMKLLHILTGQSAPVLSCAFSSDGAIVVSGSVDKTVTVYDATRGVLLHTLSQHERYVTAVSTAPTKPWIASGSMDRTVHVWRVGDGDSSGAAEPAETVCQGRNSLVAIWSEEDVGSWLAEEGMEELVRVFKANNIDGVELTQLSMETLTSDLRIESVGLCNRLLRKIQTLKEATGTPDEFLCPITRELMADPVVAADGYSYEREAIESWVRAKNRTSPMTNLPLQTTAMTPNRSLKMAIARWKSSH